MTKSDSKNDAWVVKITHSSIGSALRWSYHFSYQRTNQLFEFCYNLRFHVLKIFRIKEPLVLGYWKLEVLKIFRIKEPQIWGLWRKISEKDKTSSSGIFWKFSKHPVSFMKELTKNLQFRAGSLTGSLVSWGPGLWVVPSSLIFWEPLVKGPDTWPLPTGSFFEKERTTKHWNILYTVKEAHGIVAPCAKSLHHGPFPPWHGRMQSSICGQEVTDHFAS